MDSQIVRALIMKGIQHPIKNNVKHDQFLIEEARIYQSKFVLHTNYQGSASFMKVIKFNKCVLESIPHYRILLELCQNLTSLSFIECNLTKVTREDLWGLGGLKELYLSWNAIEKLPKGLFDFTPYLEIVAVNRNKIKEIDADILSSLRYLKYFDMSYNISINAKYNAINGEGNIKTLVELKKEILKCPPIEQVIAEMRSEIASLKFQNETLKKELEIKFNNMKTIFSDFTVSINNKEFRVNKEVLAANSPLLARLIRENRDNNHLELHDITEATFEEILKFMYEKRPPGNGVNMVELYVASARLEMKELKDMAAEILMDKVTPDNAFDIMTLCKKYPHDKMNKKAFDELKKNFPN